MINTVIKAAVKLFSRIIIRKLSDEDKITFRKVEKCTKESIKLDAHAYFLKFCLNNDLSPKFCNFKLYKTERRHDDDSNQFRKKLMEKELSDQLNSLGKARSRSLREITTLRRSVGYVRFYSCLAFLHRNLATYEADTYLKINRKLTRLYGAPIPKKLSKNTIFNLSNHALSQDETSVLNRGLNFSIPTKTNYLQNKISVENLYRDIECERNKGNITIKN